MIQLKLGGSADQPLEVLCLGCHSDDIEIGCGGTILRLAEEYPKAVFHWVVFSATGTWLRQWGGVAGTVNNPLTDSPGLFASGESIRRFGAASSAPRPRAGDRAAPHKWPTAPAAIETLQKR